MEKLVREAKQNYDFIVVDTPPLAMLSGAFPLLKLADGVLVVSRLKHNRRDVAMRLRTTLETAEAPLTGFVANGYRARGGNTYGCGYGYSYGSGSDDRPIIEPQPSIPSEPASVSNGGLESAARRQQGDASESTPTAH